MLFYRFSYALKDKAIDLEAPNHAINTIKYYVMNRLNERANQTFARRVPRK
jgi:hypothetical protein